MRYRIINCYTVIYYIRYTGWGEASVSEGGCFATISIVSILVAMSSVVAQLNSVVLYYVVLLVYQYISNR